ncbi:hypothetical protein P3W33_18095 [Luteibacter sp. PPL552]
MPKLNKPFCGVPDGQIYPVEYAAGDECPAELVTAAKALGALDKDTVELTPGQQLVAGKAADVIASLDGQTDVDLLKQAREAEAGANNSRTTVIAALDAAIEKLSGAKE